MTIDRRGFLASTGLLGVLGEVKEAEDVAVMRIRAGDILVLTCAGPISQARAEEIRNMVEERLPPGVKAMVLANGLTASVLRFE